MTVTKTPTGAELSATNAWSRRVRRIGGFIQVAFAAFWLVRGGLNIRGGVGVALAAGFAARRRRCRGVRRSGHRGHRATAEESRSEAHRAGRDHRYRHPAGCVVRIAGPSSSRPVTATGCCLPSRSPSDRCCSGSTAASTSPGTVSSAGRSSSGPLLLVATRQAPRSPRAPVSRPVHSCSTPRAQVSIDLARIRPRSS